MISVAEKLNLWRIPCIIHILNLVFETFITECKTEIDPFLNLVETLNKYTKYTILVEQNKIKKIPSYVETRWTRILVFLETKDYMFKFCQSHKKDFPFHKCLDKIDLLKDLCTEYLRIVTFSKVMNLVLQDSS